MDKPTCDDLLEEVGYSEISRISDPSWRHGTRERAVYQRDSDNTLWAAEYRLSADGETNELREGLADIYQVAPKVIATTIYLRKTEADHD